MKDIEKESIGNEEQPKKRNSKLPKNKQITDDSTAAFPSREAISRLIEKTVEKYSDNHLKYSRDDFECLQRMVSEFLEDYMIIGHTLDGQRVVIKNVSTPAQLDSLTELCKKILVRMIAQEQSGN